MTRKSHQRLAPSAPNSPSVFAGLYAALNGAASLIADSLPLHYIPLRHRFFFTRNNRLRARYVCLAALAIPLAASFGFSGGQNGTFEARSLAGLEPAAGFAQQVIAGAHGLRLAPIGETEENTEEGGYRSWLSGHRDRSGQIRRAPSAIESAALVNEDTQGVEPAFEKTEDPRNTVVSIGKGDTLSEVLQKAGATADEAYQLVQEMTRHVNPKSMRVGQKIEVHRAPIEDGRLALTQVSYIVDPLKTLHVKREASGSYHSQLDEQAVKAQRQAARVDINGSLYGSANKAGLPDKIVGNAIRLFSYTIDFQRDIKDGDRLEVLYDSYKTDAGHVAKTGDIIYARMVLGGREFPIYRYENKDGRVDYFTPDGRNIRKSSTLMKTPIDGARMSSGFGMRRHPVLGYTKMHKGVDFAAPTGTPIYAAGDGVVERAGRFSSFGNYIRIRHSAKLDTAYAHMSRFASGIRPGSRVAQGQVIGYVGTTGRSTGPHLHYEVIVNNVSVNPRSVKLPESNKLDGKELKRFQQQIRQMDQEYTSLRGVHVASRDQGANPVE